MYGIGRPFTFWLEGNVSRETWDFLKSGKAEMFHVKHLFCFSKIGDCAICFCHDPMAMTCVWRRASTNLNQRKHNFSK